MGNNKRYNIADVANELFFQIPKVLVMGDEYVNLTSSERIIYGILKDRHSLSVQSRWLDKNGDVYFVFLVEKFAREFKFAESTVKSAVKNLEKFGLLEKKRRGQGKCNIYYLLKPNVTSDDIYKIQKSKNQMDEIQKSEIRTSRNPIRQPLKVQNSTTNNTEAIDINITDIPYQNHNIDCDIDVDNLTNEIIEYVRQQVRSKVGIQKIIIGTICSDTQKQLADEITEIILFNVFLERNNDTLNIGNKNNPDLKPMVIIKNVFNKNLSYSVLITYLQRLKESGRVISKNAINYHIKALYKQCLENTSRLRSEEGYTQ
jgi:predicted transcriptional regulator